MHTFFPKAGKSIRYKLFSLVLIKNDDTVVFKSLFNKLMEHESSEKCVYSLSLLKGNPANQFFQRGTVKMQNKIYIGYWPENKKHIENLKIENIYIEQGAL